MTFEVEFYEEHAALLFVHSSLEAFPVRGETPFARLAQGTACVLCCASALEAIVNRIFQHSESISTWDEFKIISKIVTLHELKGKKVNLGELPWQDITKLIRIRNWLAHSKETYIGLSNSDNQWIEKTKIIDPETDLDKDSIMKMYNSVRKAGLILSEIWGLKSTFQFLEDEKYLPLIS